MTYVIKRTAIFTAVSPITKILYSSPIILMQSNSTGLMRIYNTVTKKMGNVNANIPVY